MKVETGGRERLYLVDATNDMFALECSDQLGEDYTIPEAFFHLHDAEAKLLAKTAFYPLLGLTDVTQILVRLEQMPLGICPETPCETRGGQRRRVGGCRGLVAGQTQTTGDAGDVIGVSETRCNSVVGDGIIMGADKIEGFFLLRGGLVHWWRCVIGVIAVTTGYAREMATKSAGTNLTIRGSLFVGHV